MKNNKKGFAIVFAMGMALISTLVVIYLLEYMIPFSKNVKGIENSTAAYYHGMSAVENALFFITQNDIGSESSASMPLTSTGYSYQISAMGTVIPSPGYGNSEFDEPNKEWSRLRPGEPVQISLPAGMSNLDTVKLFLRVPNFDRNSGTTENIESGTIEYVNWQISGTGDTLNSIATSRFIGSDICTSTNISGLCNPTTGGKIIGIKQGIPLAGGSNISVSNFYTANCNSLPSYKCSLKFSIINSLKTTGGKIIPYIEYKLSFGSTNIPRNVIRINVKGKSYGFHKEFDIYSPRESLIEAYDFTVFQ